MSRRSGISPLLLIIFCGVIIIGAGMYTYMLWVYPMTSHIQQNKQQAQMIKNQVLIKAAQVKQAEGINVDALIKQVPGSDHYDNYLMLLDDLASATNNKLLSINANSGGGTSSSGGSTASTSSSSKINSMTLDLNITAPNFSAMRQFINRLENDTRISRIDKLDFSAPHLPKSPITYTISVTIYDDPHAVQLDHGQGLVHDAFFGPAGKTNPF